MNRIYDPQGESALRNIKLNIAIRNYLFDSNRKLTYVYMELNDRNVLSEMSDNLSKSSMFHTNENSTLTTKVFSFWHPVFLTARFQECLQGSHASVIRISPPPPNVNFFSLWRGIIVADFRAIVSFNAVSHWDFGLYRLNYTAWTQRSFFLVSTALGNGPTIQLSPWVK